MYHIFIMHLLADGHLGCLHCLVIVNRAAMHTAEQVSGIGCQVLWAHAKVWYSWVRGSIFFSFLRILHIDFQSDWTSLQSQQHAFADFFWGVIFIFLIKVR